MGEEAGCTSANGELQAAGTTMATSASSRKSGKGRRASVTVHLSLSLGLRNIEP
jgi:hypothetical protein